MRTLNVHEAKTKLSSLLAEVEKNGETFLICRNGRPVADLVPHRKERRLVPHPVMRKIKINYEPTAPLAADEWPEEE